MARQVSQITRIFIGHEKAQKKLDADYADCEEFVFGLAGVPPHGWRTSLGKVFLQCEHLRKPAAFVHKAVKTAFLSSQPISYVGRKN